MNNQSSDTLDFTERNEFGREKIAAKVIQLLTAEIEISPMVIDGDWGTGKTEFCHKLIKRFRREHGKYKLLYKEKDRIRISVFKGFWCFYLLFSA